MSSIPPDPSSEIPLRPHSYDGIREYDNRLPNWWLFTLYIAIVFWFGYWAEVQWFHVFPTNAQRVEREIASLEAAKMTALAETKLDDTSLWQMSRNPVMVDAGRAIFNTTCVSCHLASLRGKGENPAAIGADLTTRVWLHGGHPTELLQTITHGVPLKGMPVWGPVLGQKRIIQVLAYVLSHHTEGEPATLKPSPAPAPPK